MYDLDWEPGTREQLLGVPYDAVLEFADVLAGVLVDPWGFQRQADEPDDDHHAHRTVPFAGGLGLLTFLILEHRAEVHITGIAWLG